MEFWGQVLTNAAKEQKLLEEALKWMAQGMSGSENLLALFRRAYGLEMKPDSSSDVSNLWKQAQEAFQKSAKDYLSLCGVVPLQEHLALVRKYEDLKKKVAAQEETINNLRMLVEFKATGQEELQKGFQDLIETQTDQFMELMKGLEYLTKKDVDPTP